MSEQMTYILSEISKQNPLHGKKLKKTLSALKDYEQIADHVIDKYSALLKKQGRTIDYGIDCYLKMINDVTYESVQFIQSGKYTSTSFEEVNKRVYGNPEIMEYYMHGLIMSTVLWRHHYHIYNFFVNTFPKYTKDVKRYLEIGGGHGLFVSEAMRILPKDAAIDLVDISQSSINMAKGLIDSNRVNYILHDVYKYDKDKTYDFVTMGEVLEHVEDPLGLLKKIKSLLKDTGTAYITTPTNAPAIDHIYLFNNVQEIRDLIHKAGFEIKDELVLPTEDMTEEEANRTKTTLLYAAFIK